MQSLAGKGVSFEGAADSRRPRSKAAFGTASHGGAGDASANSNVGVARASQRLADIAAAGKAGGRSSDLDERAADTAKLLMAEFPEPDFPVNAWAQSGGVGEANGCKILRQASSKSDELPNRAASRDCIRIKRRRNQTLPQQRACVF